MDFTFKSMILLCLAADIVFASPDVLTTTADINALPNGRPMRGTARLEGNVVGLTSLGFSFKDNTGYLIVRNDTDVRPIPGDRINLAAKTRIDSIGNLYVDATNIIVISHGPALEHALVLSTDIKSGRYDYRPVTVKGIVTDAFRDEVDPNWNWLYIQDEGGHTVASFRDPLIKQRKLDELLDAEVTITGISKPSSHGSRRFFEKCIEISSRAEIHIEKPAPQDSFDARPLLSVNDLVGKSGRKNHRWRLEGRVIAAWHGDRLFLRMDDDQYVRVQLRNPARLPPCGAHVTVVGSIRRNAFYVTISKALFRTNPYPLRSNWNIRNMTAKEILLGENGENRINPNLDGRLISLKGNVCHISTIRSNETCISLDDGEYMIPVEIGNATPPEIGSVVEVTGACLMDVEPDEGGTRFGRIKRFSVISRSPEDIKIISRPPWWTPGRLLTVIVVLSAILAAIFAWNRVLRRIVERRSRALLKSEIAKVGAELRIDERTRLAVELHDSIAQDLTAISLQIAAAETAQKMKPAAANRHIETADRMLKSCRTELRRCLWDLRGEALEERDFAEAIRKTLRPVVGTSEVAVRVLVSRTRLSDSTAHAVLRILRELTANAVCHGKAKHVHVAGEQTKGVMRFSVRDDGCGFVPERCPGSDLGHFGLDGIRERIKHLGGTFTLESLPGDGTYARFEFGIAPLNEERPTTT